MTIKKASFSLYSILLSFTTPISLFTYGQIRKSQRGALACEGETDCVDLRGLNELPFLFGIWIASAVVAVILSINAGKRGEPKAKIALWISSVMAVLPILLIIVSLLIND